MGQSKEKVHHGTERTQTRFIMGQKEHKQRKRSTYMHNATTSCLWCHATSNLVQHNSHQIGNRNRKRHISYYMQNQYTLRHAECKIS